MVLKTVKMSDDNYRWLSTVAGEIQQEIGKPVSIDEAIRSLRSGRDIAKLAGSWEMTDAESKKINEDLKGAWKQWQIKSV